MGKPVSDMFLSHNLGSNALCITFPGQATFTVTLPDLTIQTTPACPDYPPETLDHLLYDHVLPRVIAHQGDLVLHGGGVLIGTQAIAVIAETGRGKSTLTASLHAAGNPMLGDDALIVTADASEESKTHHIRAVYPSLRLNPDSASRFFPGEAGRLMAHYSDKRHLPLGKTIATAPLAAVFLIGEPSDIITIRRITSAEACMTLIAHSFALDPTDTARAREKLGKVSAMVAAIPIWEIRYPLDYDCLPDVYETIQAQLVSLDTKDSAHRYGR